MKINKTRALVFLVLLFSDIFCIVLSLYLAYHSRFYSVFVNVLPVTRGLPEYVFYMHLLYFVVPLWLLIIYQHKLYRTFFLPPLDDLIRVVRAVSLSVIFTLLAIFFYREFSYSRGVLALFWGYSICTIYLARQLIRYFVKYSFRSLIGREGILVVGVNNKMIKNILKQYHYKK